MGWKVEAGGVSRRSFLGRAAAAVAALTGADRLADALPAPAAVAAPDAPALTAVALTASGGLCAPLSPYYTLDSLRVSPVAAALPSFEASRGGVTYRRPR